MWGARGQFPPAAAMVVMFVLGRWFTSAHIYFGIVHIFYRIKMFWRPTALRPIKTVKVETNT